MEVFPDVRALTVAAAERFALLAAKAVQHHDLFTVALSGGSTPNMLYRLMASDAALRAKIPWSKIHFFFGDERHVPPDHPDSNFRMANEAMFHALPIEQLHVHRVPAELADATHAAALYEKDLTEFFEPRGLLNKGFPRFDLIFLGMGPDGHTASLFPSSSGLQETSRWVVANWISKFESYRITMTFPLLDSAREVILFVAGSEKSALLAEVMQLGTDAQKYQKYPVQQVRPRDGIKRWMLDSSAAARINNFQSEATQA